MSETLLSVRDLRVQFDTDEGVVKAVDGVSFDVHRGEVFAIVGESGSGKSVTAMSILGLIPNAKVAGGEAWWKETNLLKAREGDMRNIRGGEIAMIFQDPLTALNPVHKVGRQIGEMVRIHRDANARQARERAIELLDLVGIPQPGRRVDNYPHEFSGGMRQRAMIAMAIACEPDLLVADEPTTALDVTVQAQVLEVLMEIKNRIRSAIIIITHDLGLVAGSADRVMVMYAGRAVEQGSTDDVFYDTRHPYTLGLLASLPRVDDTGTERLVPIKGAPPSLISVPPGCPFHPRCEYARLPDPCAAVVPPFIPIEGEPGHGSACHFAGDLARVDLAEIRAGGSLE
jgi:oligopeptide/dipeptide ABC transporter ATP-binding protein